ncbi:MAG: hypothetical protein ONB46_21145 [candidate division KSB1 bacterium]|nr:hypothetical protein [candidate division KSB1 bacterium]MDZ7368449.1 hypothetical protein [candidate division KSB1 bacterium]MDZ7406175.1 hypothetical protein [candidate division KSB1 bacterium]
MAMVRVKANRVPKSKQKVTFEVKIKGELNITAFVARQRVNRYLLMHVGNLLRAGEPDLSVSKGLAQWDVPIIYSLPDRGNLGTVGHFLVDAQNGDIKLKNSTPIQEIEARVTRLYQQATSQTRA